MTQNCKYQMESFESCAICRTYNSVQLIPIKKILIKNVPRDNKSPEFATIEIT